MQHLFIAIDIEIAHIDACRSFHLGSLVRDRQTSLFQNRAVVGPCDNLGIDHLVELYKMINPEIVARSDDRSVLEEGCLSIPHQTAEVERPASVDVRYLDIDGNEQMLHCEGLLAACVQHEIDHLDGVLFIDHLSRLKRDMIVRKALKELRQSATSSGRG